MYACMYIYVLLLLIVPLSSHIPSTIVILLY